MYKVIRIDREGHKETLFETNSAVFTTELLAKAIGDVVWSIDEYIEHLNRQISVFGDRLPYSKVSFSEKLFHALSAKGAGKKHVLTYGNHETYTAFFNEVLDLSEVAHSKVRFKIVPKKRVETSVLGKT